MLQRAVVMLSLSALLLGGASALSGRFIMAPDSLRVALAAEVPLSEAGRRLYGKYCRSCHGVEGQGDGPVASSLKVKPADLSLLKKKAGGTFPRDRVIQAIDGRQMPKAHGLSEMPVWGEWFASQAMADGVLQEDKAGIEKKIKARLKALTAYLESLQN